MIYIFDDRAQRRKNNEEKLRKYQDCVRFMTVRLIPGKSVEESVIDSIDAPECIIFHKSYVFEDSDVTFETIRHLFRSFDVPVVIFSGGIEGSGKGEKETNMNADLMYQNLPYFIDNLKENKEINIYTLLWGEKYELNAMLKFQNEIAKKFFINNNPDDKIDNIAEVIRFIKNSIRGLHMGWGDALLNKIKDCGHLTWLELANMIDNTVQNFK